MNFFPRKRLILIIAFLIAIVAPGSLLLLSQTASSETAGKKPEPPAQSRKAAESAPYHKNMSYQHGGDWNSSSKLAKSVPPVAAHSSSVALAHIKILPSSISIDGPRYTQRIVVEGTFADGHQEDLTSEAKLASSAPQIALVDKEAFAHPQGNGHATITATVRGLRASAQVEVQNFSKVFAWSFRNDVLPVMTKAGCNSGPCHGAAAGKNGFKLTLRGFDPQRVLQRTQRPFPRVKTRP